MIENLRFKLALLLMSFTHKRLHKRAASHCRKAMIDQGREILEGTGFSTGFSEEGFDYANL
jgi:hypothetical protein